MAEAEDVFERDGGDEDDDEASTGFGHFNLDDLFRFYHGNTGGAAKQQLARRLADKIVANARDEYHTYDRQGLAQAGIDALKKAVKVLETHDDGKSEIWHLAQAELLLDLGDVPHARKLLNFRPDTNHRSRLGSVASIKTLSPQDAKDVADKEYEHMMNQRTNVQQWLELAVRAEQWDQTPLFEAEMREVDPSYFIIQKPMKRMEKIRQLLYLGLLAERKAEMDGPAFRDKHMLDALRTYNYGCWYTSLGQSLYNFDHGDCQSLFLSAARICINFAKRPPAEGEKPRLNPSDLAFEPPLQGQTWELQAWQYLEVGRARALLESIVRGDTYLPKRFRGFLLLAAVHTIRGSIRHKRRDTSHTSGHKTPQPGHAQQTAQDRPMEVRTIPPTVTNNPPMDRKSSAPRPNHEHPAAGLPPLKTTDLARLTSREVVSSSPLDLLTAREGLTPEQRRKAQTRWTRAYFFAKAIVNPVTKDAVAAALPSSSLFLDLDRARAAVPPDTLVIEYGLPSAAAAGLITMVIDCSGVLEGIWQELNVPKLKNEVQELRTAMYSQNARARDIAHAWPSHVDRERLDDLQESLYKCLIQPIAHHLAKAKRLVIIPSGELVHVPWSMFVEKPVSTCPSLSIWQALHERGSSSDETDPKVSVMSNAPIDSRTNEPRDIPYSRLEALYVAQQNQDTRPELADDFDWDAFGSIASSAQVLHLCAHSSFNNQSPMRSTIQLFRDPVTLSQWHNLTMQADLVTFSSCLSGMAKAYDSGSTIGFAHTLLATGTKAFIGSLWPVDDDATLLLMVMFYEELQKPSPPADALHAAQMRMRNLDEDALWSIQERLSLMLDQVGADATKYVDNPKYWLDKLNESKVEGLREPRCWAAFTLTGYGFRSLYPARNAPACND